LLELFPSRFSAAIKQANWAYYEPRTEHGSSLSACAYALVATEFGNLEFAYKYFLQTAQIDLLAKYKTQVGTIFVGGSHPAANGGAWMTAVAGFGGLRADEKQVVINPRLYRKWRSLEFSLDYQGDRFRIQLTPDAVTVTPQPANRSEHRFVIAGEIVTCAPGLAVTIKCGHAPTALATTSAQIS
jgi:kojibiose phosphorylase